MLPIPEIENAVIHQIKMAKLPYLRFVGSYGGELMGDWQDTIRALPAMWITFKEATAPERKETAHTRCLTRLTFSTIVAARSVRCEEATRKGGPSCVGTYRMLDDVARLICMQDFGLENVDYLRPGPVRSLFSGKVQAMGLSVLSQDWTVLTQFWLREPGQAPFPTPGEDAPTGYLPLDGQTFPGAANIHNPALLPDMRTLGMRYWLKPLQRIATDQPAAEDRITLNISL